MGTAGARADDPLFTLREYRQLAPWNLRDLATVAGALLDASGVRPINAAASAHPSERTIRFYVTRGLVEPPEGRGTAATYTYRHLLQVLAIKLRQMEGATLAAIGTELRETTGDVLERRVAVALGPGLPGPNRLPLTGTETEPRGRAGRAFRTVLEPATAEPAGERPAASWRRLEVARGVELHIREDHPLARLTDRQAELADAVRLTVGRVLSQNWSPRAAPAPEPAEPSGLRS